MYLKETHTCRIMSIYAYLPIIALPPSISRSMARIAQDEYAVDAWQLGVLAFFLLTGWRAVNGETGETGGMKIIIFPWFQWGYFS